MTQAETLLKMIESVDKDDTEKLDEIDARFWCFVYNSELVEYPKTLKKRNDEGVSIHRHLLRARNKKYPEGFTEYLIKYTRSIDAQQSVMPEGWAIMVANCSHTAEIETLLKVWTSYIKKGDVDILAPDLPTEALARLHALIQAIEYDKEE